MLNFTEVMNQYYRSLTANTPDGGMCRISHGGKFVEPGLPIGVSIFGAGKIYPHSTSAFRSEDEAIAWANAFFHNRQQSGASDGTR